MTKFIFKISILGLGLSMACNDNTSMRNVDLDESAFLVNIGSNIIVPAYEDLVNEVETLHASVGTFTESPTVINLTQLRAQLKAASISWQSANMLGFGPAANVSLSAQINIFPVDKHQIEENIENGEYDLAKLSNIDTKGFPGAAFLIYGDDKTDKQIIELFTTDANAQNRIQYLKDISANMESSSKAVLQAWEDEYLEQFTASSSYGTSVGSSASQLFNTMIQTYERQTRDGKIGIPVGVRSLGEIIPTSTEAYYGGYSAELAIANIQQYKNIFNGNTEAGFDDYLIAHGREDLVAEANENFEDVLEKLALVSDPLSDQIINNQAAVEAVFIAMQELVNLLKTDVASQLSIEITFTDTDGD
ncbi:MAG: imelysin family protein [Cyclobacteriaceae bacterium]